MYYYYRYLIILLFILALATSCKKRNQKDNVIRDYTVFVDPMIGTSGHGHTFPGATLPFGMVQLSPDNGKNGWDWSSGYHYSSDTIVGFSHTHLSGTGVGDLLDILVNPTTFPIPYDLPDSLVLNVRDYYSSFSHDEEEASPGYYSVYLSDPEITAEMTVTERAGFHRYTPENSDIISLIIDLEHSVNYDSVVQSHIKFISDTLISGFRQSTGWANNQKVFFAMRFSHPLQQFRLFSNDTTILGDSVSIQARGVQGAFSFATNNNPLLVKVGLSSVSEENALINLNNEIPEWDFEKVRANARDIWNSQLSKIRVTSRDQEKMKIFYTSMYHLMIAPNLYGDSLFNNTFEYRASNDEIRTDKAFKKHSTFSLWDTYRAAHPLFTIIQKEKVRHFIASLLAHYRDTGLLPVWTLWANETNTMIGYHSIPVIVDAYMKGLIPDISADSLYNAILSSARQEIRQTPLYMEYGYIPADTLSNTVSKTLEYAYDDWCIAQIADQLGRDRDFISFLNRSEAYRNLFDPETRFMRPKLANGEWKTPFDPLDTRYNNDYTEGNAWQYSWYVPQNITDLINLMGGKNRFNNKLDSLFSISSKLREDAVVDVSGMIGQYVHGNEPSHHIAYLYNYSGQPWKTQEKVRQILNTMYSAEPDGLSGNEDCGQMSAWFIFSSMGFYPVNPANGLYDLGIPYFEKIEIPLEEGKSFIIQTTNYSESNKYVKSISLNGELLDRMNVDHEEIMNGGILEFELTDTPVK